MRQDPNHYFERIAELRSEFESGRFVPHDQRTFDYSRLPTNSNILAEVLATRRLFEQLADEVLEPLDYSEVRIIAECANQLREALRDMQRRMLGGGAEPVPRDVAERFSLSFQRLSSFASAALLSKFLQEESKRSEVQRALAQDVAQLTENANASVDKAVAEVSARAEEVMAKIQSDLTEAAVARNANFFRDEAGSYARQSTIWGISCFAWFALIIVCAAWSTFDVRIFAAQAAQVKALIPGVSDGWVIAQISASKLVLLGTATFVGIVLVRAFLSTLNSHITNRHRAVSLDTYKFLLDGARTDSDRQHVVQRAAEAVFAIQETGLIRTLPSEAGPVNTTVNLPRFG